MQAPKAKSATQNKVMGKVKSSPYKGTSVTTKTGSTTKPLNHKNLLVLVLVVGAGALVILYLRSRNGQTPIQSGPLTVLTQSAAPDQFQIDNLTAGILALAGNSQVSTGGQVTSLPTNPGGGTSTPITANPTERSNWKPDNWLSLSKLDQYNLWIANTTQTGTAEGQAAYNAMIAKAKAMGGSVEEQGANFDALVRQAYKEQNPESYQTQLASGASVGFLRAMGVANA